MGFKCPACNKDFGIDKAMWESHIKICNGGVASVLVGIVKSAAETTRKHSLTDTPKTKIKADTYYDITCGDCGHSWSTDFMGGLGMHESKKGLIKHAYKLGWKSIDGKTMCPDCISRMNICSKER